MTGLAQLICQLPTLDDIFPLIAGPKEAAHFGRKPPFSLGD